MPSFKLFAPIRKVDEVQRMVWGTAIAEEPDKSGEIFDYASSIANFKAWSGEIEKATDGKSKGNVRAQHGKIAAGKLTGLEYDDSRKAIDIAAKIVDEAEWEKVKEGVYTGFSVGGSYEKRWKDGDLMRYTALPSEISIVDNPCVPSAHFTMVKADGTEVETEFSSPPEPVQVWICQKGHEHQRKDEARFCKSEKNAAGSQAARDGESTGVEGSSPRPAAPSLSKITPSEIYASERMHKCLDGVVGVVSSIQSVKWAQMIEAREAQAEGDTSAAAASLKRVGSDLYEILIQLAEECAAEYAAGTEYDNTSDAFAMALSGVLAKAKADPARLAKAFGAKETKIMPDPETKPAAVEPAAPVAVVEKIDAPDLAKFAGEIAELKKAVETEKGANAERIATLEKTVSDQTEVIGLMAAAMPERAKVALRAVTVTKADDGGPAGEKPKETLKKEAEAKGDALALVKIALTEGKTFPALLRR